MNHMMSRHVARSGGADVGLAPPGGAWQRSCGPHGTASAGGGGRGRKRKRSTSPTGSQPAPAPQLMLPAPQHYFRVVGVAQAATLPGVQAQVVAVGAHPLGPLGGPWDDT